MPAGSKGKYTPERVKIITDAISNELMGRLNAAKKAGICYDTFCFWMKKHPEFVEAIKKAEEAQLVNGKEFAMKCLFAAMPKSWQAAAWWLERNFPDKYALRNFNMNLNNVHLRGEMGIDINNIEKAVKELTIEELRSLAQQQSAAQQYPLLYSGFEKQN